MISSIPSSKAFFSLADSVLSQTLKILNRSFFLVGSFCLSNPNLFFRYRSPPSFFLSFFLSSSFSSTLSRESPAFFCPFFGLQSFGCLKQNLSTKRLSSTNPNLLLLLRSLLPSLLRFSTPQLPYSVFHAPPLCCRTSMPRIPRKNYTLNRLAASDGE
jgi:hypothetical protein